MVSGEQVVGTNTGVEVRLVGVAAGSGGALVDQVGDQPLRALGEITRLVLPTGGGRPGVGRTPEGACAGGDEFGGDGAGQPLEVEQPLGAGVRSQSLPGSSFADCRSITNLPRLRAWSERSIIASTSAKS